MKSVKVSIIIPVYNAEKYLERCISSVASQSLNEIEIILVNDGSSDTSPAICDAWAATDPRIQVIHQKNKGQTKARIAGLLASCGEYIHFVDSDDWIDPAMEEVLYTQAVAEDADIITCDSVFHKGHKEIEARQKFHAGIYSKADLKEHIYPAMIYGGTFFYFGIYAAMWNKLFKRDIIIPRITNVDPAVRIGEDGLSTFACFLDAEKVVVTKDLFYHYRDDNATSLTRSYQWEQFDSALLLIAYLRRIAQEHKETYDISPQIDIYLLYNVYSIVIEEFYYRTKRTHRHKYQYLRRIVTHPSVQEACQSIDSSQGFSKHHIRFLEFLKNKDIQQLLDNAANQAIERRVKYYIKKGAFSTQFSTKLVSATLSATRR